MSNKKKLPAIVIFAILTTVTTLIWIVFDVYRALTKEPSPAVTPEVLLALDPTLDTDILAQASEWVYLDDTDIGNTNLTIPEPEPAETPIPESEAIEEAEEEPEEATESASTNEQ